MPVRVYRSTDVNAPILTGTAGSLTALLDACLVNGYGSAFAGGTLTSTGVNVSDGDTVTVGSKTYTFKTTLVAGNVNQVLIGANAAASLANLAAAINYTGTSGATYTAVTLGHPDVWVTTITATVLTFAARRGGTGGNALALARSAATLTVSAATLTGGGGTDTISGSGWAKSYTAGNGLGAMYRPSAGNQLYLQVDDSAAGSGGTPSGRDARVWGWESASGYGISASPSGPAYGSFPPAAITLPVAFRKSTTADNVARPWIVCADDRTMYAFVQTGDLVGIWFGPFYFGDFYSLIPGDPWRTLLWGSGYTENIAGVGAMSNWRTGFSTAVAAGPIRDGKWMPRNGAGFAGPRQVLFTTLNALSVTGPTVYGVPSSGALGWAMTTPNPTDGGTYIGWLRVHDFTSYAATGQLSYRGRLRGLYDAFLLTAAASDLDTFNGGSSLTGRSFQLIKTANSSATAFYMAIETSNTWEVSS